MNLSRLKNLGLWLLSTYVVFLFIILLIFLFSGSSSSDLKTFFPYVAEEIIGNPIGWILLFLPYCVFKLIRYLIHTWKNHTKLTFIKRFSFTIIIPVLLLFSGFSFSNWYTQSEEFEFTWDHSFDNLQDSIQNRYDVDKKQRGVHFFGRRTKLNTEIIKDVTKTNTEWITLVPFGYQKNHDTETIGRRDSDYTKWTRRDSSFMTQITDFKKHGLYIMVKPHIWMSTESGKWRSDISQKTTEGWRKWSASYRKFILHYAKLSDLYEVDMFCIGTELHAVVKEHPEFWPSLIKDIRKIYRGKIIYAANWNQEVYDVTFWDQLDFIGIQAYFPLTDKMEPSVRDLKKGWKKHVYAIEKLHKKYQKPILFSELGYKSTSDSGIEPWTWPSHGDQLHEKVSYKTQANCYEAFFRTFWDKEWFAGVHFWEWQSGRKKHRERKDIHFTPQQKPAENVMTKWFAKLSKD